MLVLLACLLFHCLGCLRDPESTGMRYFVCQRIDFWVDEIMLCVGSTVAAEGNLGHGAVKIEAPLSERRPNEWREKAPL